MCRAAGLALGRLTGVCSVSAPHLLVEGRLGPGRQLWNDSAFAHCQKSSMFQEHDQRGYASLEAPEDLCSTALMLRSCLSRGGLASFTGPSALQGRGEQFCLHLGISQRWSLEIEFFLFQYSVYPFPFI